MDAQDFPISKREALALAEEYWEWISPDEARAERHFEEVFPVYRAQGYLDRPFFLEVWNWKNPDKRQRRHAESNTDHDVRSATEAAFGAQGAEALRALMSRSSGGTGLKGVAIRTASALLHWMRPEAFPMVDVRVFDVLRVERRFTLATYTPVANRIRSQNAIWGIGLRTVDRALWTLHKKRGETGSLPNKRSC